jgi:hypothetical protein
VGKSSLNCRVKNEDQVQSILEEIAKEDVWKYYWNQTIYFDLIQGSNLSSLEFIKEVKKKSENTM